MRTSMRKKLPETMTPQKGEKSVQKTQPTKARVNINPQFTSSKSGKKETKIKVRVQEEKEPEILHNSLGQGGQEESEQFDRESQPEYKESITHPSPDPLQKHISQDTDFARESMPESALDLDNKKEDAVIQDQSSEEVVLKSNLTSSSRKSKFHSPEVLKGRMKQEQLQIEMQNEKLNHSQISPESGEFLKIAQTILQKKEDLEIKKKDLQEQKRGLVKIAAKAEEAVMEEIVIAKKWEEENKKVEKRIQESENANKALKQQIEKLKREISRQNFQNEREVKDLESLVTQQKQEISTSSQRNASEYEQEKQVLNREQQKLYKLQNELIERENVSKSESKTLVQKKLHKKMDEEDITRSLRNLKKQFKL